MGSDQGTSPPAPVCKDLLQLERANSSSPGAKLFSICKANQHTNGEPYGAPLLDHSVRPLGESSVLSRVKAFLPVLDEANQKLKTAIEEQGAEKFDIEVLNDTERDTYVQMDLAVGVAELHTPEAVAAAERVVNGQVLNAVPLRDKGDTDSDSDSTDSEAEEDIRAESENGLPSRRGKRPKIEPL